MIPESFFSGKVRLHPNDLFDALPFIPQESVDACVTDPPYHLISIVRRFGKTSQQADTQTSARARARADGMARLSRGFMGKNWDGGDVAFRPETWREIWRVLKPGAHLIACGGSRTYHRMACAIEDAGFEIRDHIGWLYASGFPKSHNVGKGIDRMLGAKREVIGEGLPFGAGAMQARSRVEQGYRPTERNPEGGVALITAPGTPQAAEWSGWGTALKPALEPIVVARKPLIGTVAVNVLTHRTGALNIEDCRVANDNESRWPANVAHDGSIEPPNDRFFFSAKATTDERACSSHPTVKPIALMQWLVRLVTPPGGLVLDPFAGTGTTAEACLREGFRASLIEREPEYQDDIRRRLQLVLAGPEERQRATLKAKGKLLDPADLPLFAAA